MAKKTKVHSLTGRITPSVMLEAFKRVKGNRGAAGIDKVSIEMFEANLGPNLLAPMRDLKTGAFVPLPLRRTYIPKGNGKQRPLGIPAVRDRVAQEVVRRLLEPVFELRLTKYLPVFRPSGALCASKLAPGEFVTRIPMASGPVATATKRWSGSWNSVV